MEVGEEQILELFSDWCADKKKLDFQEGEMRREGGVLFSVSSLILFDRLLKNLTFSGNHKYFSRFNICKIRNRRQKKLDKVNSAKPWVKLWSHGHLRCLLALKRIPWAPEMSHGSLRSPSTSFPPKAKRLTLRLQKTLNCKFGPFLGPNDLFSHHHILCPTRPMKE